MTGCLLCTSFNQDHSCFSIGTNSGYKIFNCNTRNCCYENSEGAVSIVEMLFSASLVVLVGAGNQPELSPRRLFIFNTSTGVNMAELDFVSAVVAVRLNRKRLVVVLDRKTFIYDLPYMQSDRIELDTSLNSKGLCAFSSNEQNCHLALPASNTSGVVYVYNALESQAICQFQAHRSPLAALAFSADGLLLATASQQGTVIRVHSIPQASKLFTFRRGSYAATIYSLSFGPTTLSPQLLAATSSSGTLHIFRLTNSSTRQGVVPDILAAVMPETVSDIVEPEHHFATVKNGISPGIRSVCAIGASSAAADSARIFVVSVNGFFNEYHMSGDGVCTLEREFHLVATEPQQISAGFV